MSCLVVWGRLGRQQLGQKSYLHEVAGPPNELKGLARNVLQPDSLHVKDGDRLGCVVWGLEVGVGEQKGE